MENPKYKTYALTLRPKDGVTDPQLEKLEEWIRKRSLYYHVITEKQGSERHAHAGMVLKVPVTRGNFGTLVKRLFSELDQAEQRVLLNGVKIMYNEDFIRNYLDKDDDTVVVCSCLPEAGHMESYFPPKPAVLEKKRKCSAYYHELEQLWKKHSRPDVQVGTENVRNFLFKMMYSERCIPIIRDDRAIVQTARHLTRWISKSEESTIVLAPFENEE